MRQVPRAVTVLGLLAALWLPRQAVAEDRQARAVRTSVPIVLDGRLTEPAWDGATAASGLTQWEPRRGQPARLDMRVKVLYDDSHVYVGAWLPKPRSIGPVVGHLHRRDQWSASDWFEVDFDTMHDHWTAYQFYVNPSNVQMDVLLMGPASDDGWDAVWESATNVAQDGWSVEARFPLSIFRLQPGGSPQTWGFNFGRQEPLEREIACWTVPPREVANGVSVFGHLTGFEGLHQRMRLELLPYVSPRRALSSTERSDGSTWGARAGVDARIGFGAAHEVTLTVKPDFGQVEVDQTVLNLSTVETLLPEKRPFFTQGLEIFRNAFGPDFFYSRRIGRGLVRPSLGEGERITERPLAVEVLAAAKYTGRLAGGRTVGALGAVTEGATARTVDAEGRAREIPLSPPSAYGVVSVIQPLGSHGSRLSAMATWLEQTGASARRAAVAATEGSYQSRSSRYTLQGVAAVSRTGPKASQTIGSMQAARITLGLGAGGVLRVTGWNVTRQFEINDVGYIERPDQRGGTVVHSKTWDRTWGPLRNWYTETTMARTDDQAGRPFFGVVRLQVGSSTTRQWRGALLVERALPTEDDRELRAFGDARKKYLHVPAGSTVTAEVGTPRHWRWSAEGSFTISRRFGGSALEGGLVQSLRPSARWQIGIESRYTEERRTLRYLTTVDGTAPLPGQSPGIPLVGERDLGQFEQVLRVSHTVSPRLSVQLFLQGLAASWAFRDPRFYVDDRTLAPGLPDGAGEPETRFASRVLNANVVVRWEFRPGSTFYLVYTRGATDGGAGALGDRIRPLADLAGLGRLHGDAVVQAKVSWLLR